MKKKLFSLLTALVLCLLCAVPAFAEMPLVMDTYELFKPEATAELEQKAQDASAGHGVNVYLLTVADIGGQNVREFAASRRSKIRSCRCSRTERITRPPKPT